MIDAGGENQRGEGAREGWIVAYRGGDANDTVLVAHKLNGWQRIGVILSALWFVGFGVFMFEHQMSGHSTFWDWQLDICVKIAETSAGTTSPMDTGAISMAGMARAATSISNTAKAMSAQCSLEQYAQCADRVDAGRRA
jgi:hypothetical protein